MKGLPAVFAEWFQARGWQPVKRNNLPIGDVWLANTTMSKSLDGSDAKPAGGKPGDAA